jgi:hypothetical protein
MNSLTYKQRIVDLFGDKQGRLEEMLIRLLKTHRNEVENEKIIKEVRRNLKYYIQENQNNTDMIYLDKKEVETKIDNIPEDFITKYKSSDFEISIDLLLRSNETIYNKALGIARLAILFPGWHPIASIIDIFPDFYNIAEVNHHIIFDDTRGDQFFRVEQKKHLYITQEEKETTGE